MSVSKPFQFVVAFFVCLLAINVGLLVWAWSSSYAIVDENGPLENFQVFILGLSFVTYVLIFSKQEGAAQTLAAVFCFLCVFMFLKELDFKQLKLIGPGVGYWIENTLAERFLKLLQWLNLLFLIVFLISRIREMPALARAMLSWPAWPFYMSFALLVLSQALEHEGFPNSEKLAGAAHYKTLTYFHHSEGIAKFWEELIELNAFMLLLYAAQSSTAIFSRINRRWDKCPLAG